MALIKCKECNKDISDKATVCVHCGCPIKNETKYYCDECGKVITKKNKVCPNCGCPTNSNKNNRTENNNNLVKEKLSKYINNIREKSKKTLILTFVSIIILVLLMIFIFTKETSMYRMSSNLEIYESITLQSFGKCYYFYHNLDDESKSESDSNCTWNKSGSSYTINISGKTLYCNRNDKDVSCKYNDRTLKYKID